MRVSLQGLLLGFGGCVVERGKWFPFPTPPVEDTAMLLGDKGGSKGTWRRTRPDARLEKGSSGSSCCRCQLSGVLTGDFIGVGFLQDSGSLAAVKCRHLFAGLI